MLQAVDAKTCNLPLPCKYLITSFKIPTFEINDSKFFDRQKPQCLTLELLDRRELYVAFLLILKTSQMYANPELFVELSGGNFLPIDHKLQKMGVID